MTMISKGTLGICAGVAGALFLGYCIYFDQRRRSDPEFKKKLRERRKDLRVSVGRVSCVVPGVTCPRHGVSWQECDGEFPLE